ncbi:MAG: NAD-binding protein [Firmicutes bacterium]|uniref:NAD-binding protein n=1 Tax=Candidatus Alloenteromonas pullistercoris TaxID=2840785 RepID=A0A9D9GTF0_9FIRM|nr:NAD-binding protein [Candidatus Enteromonas pullistercoris]
MKNTIVVIGCGRLGSSIANYASQSGEDVIVIDAEKDSFDRLDDVFSGYAKTADATDVDALIDAGVNEAREILITTGDDNVNLFLAHLCAKKFKNPYIYVRFNDPDKGLLIQGLAVKAIYPFQLSRDRFSLLREGSGKGEER